MITDRHPFLAMANDIDDICKPCVNLEYIYFHTVKHLSGWGRPQNIRAQVQIEHEKGIMTNRSPIENDIDLISSLPKMPC
ncbi:hypothetical protein [Legionella waltersii]|uniref:Uncharacterized protein n=1 Tax=Legionella waltersii TaxID=66969 RepID=A0A0W1A6H2_9GAMM|nr:hypothetical protein [Legionella waltersii]KTD76595.1 hypothetical protein Lwal_2317 [Legionella waltersii]SNU94509.1 Uncharacterised protein [Legionella waltersii]